MNSTAAVVLGLGLVGAAVGLAVAFGGKASPASSGPSRPGYSIQPGCQGFLVADEATALAYARAEGAAAPSVGWPQRVMLRVFGPTCAALTPAAAIGVFSKQPGFIWRMIHAAIAGGVAGGRFSRDQAQQALDVIRGQALAAGASAAELEPAMVEG